jgi:hypothetical protein
MKTLKYEEIHAYEYETMNDVTQRLPRFGTRVGTHRP